MAVVLAGTGALVAAPAAAQEPALVVGERVTLDPTASEVVVDTAVVLTVRVEAVRDDGSATPVPAATPAVFVDGHGTLVADGCGAGTGADGTCLVTVTAATPGTATIAASTPDDRLPGPAVATVTWTAAPDPVDPDPVDPDPVDPDPVDPDPVDPGEGELIDPVEQERPGEGDLVAPEEQVRDDRTEVLGRSEERAVGGAVEHDDDATDDGDTTAGAADVAARTADVAPGAAATLPATGTSTTTAVVLAAALLASGAGLLRARPRTTD